MGYVGYCGNYGCNYPSYNNCGQPRCCQSNCCQPKCCGKVTVCNCGTSTITDVTIREEGPPLTTTVLSDLAVAQCVSATINSQSFTLHWTGGPPAGVPFSGCVSKSTVIEPVKYTITATYKCNCWNIDIAVAPTP